MFSSVRFCFLNAHFSEVSMELLFDFIITTWIAFWSMHHIPSDFKHCQKCAFQRYHLMLIGLHCCACLAWSSNMIFHFALHTIEWHNQVGDIWHCVQHIHVYVYTMHVRVLVCSALHRAQSTVCGAACCYLLTTLLSPSILGKTQNDKLPCQKTTKSFISSFPPISCYAIFTIQTVCKMEFNPLSYLTWFILALWILSLWRNILSQTDQPTKLGIHIGK